MENTQTVDMTSHQNTLSAEKVHSINDESLTSSQKTIIWIFSIFNPVITGGVLYYIWKDPYPKKANQSNKISITVFIIEFVVSIALLLII